MDNKKIVNQMINFHKTSFENCFSIMLTLQLQAENILNILYYFPIMTDESKKFIKQGTDSYKKWIDDFKKASDEGYAKVEEFYDNEAMVMFQEQTENMLNQKNWMSMDLKKTMEELNALYKRGCDEFMKYVDENRRSGKNFSPVANKTQTKPKTTAKKK